MGIGIVLMVSALYGSYGLAGALAAANGVSWAIGTAILSTALPITLFLSGLQKLKNSEASILSTVEPLTAIAAAYLILGERPSFVQTLGAIAVLGTLVVVATAKRA